MGESVATPKRAVTQSWLLLLVAFIIVTSAYFYDLRVSGSTVRFGRLTADGGPSDFYPIWEGSRLMLHERISPYSPAAVAVLQRGFYNYLSPTAAMQETDRSFAYPLYVVYLAYPFLALPFDVAALAFALLGLMLSVVSIYLWTAAIGWPHGLPLRLTVALLTAAFYGVINGFLLSQVSAFILPLVGLLGWALWRRQYLLAGSTLALFILKPHLAFLVVPVVLFWAMWHWRAAAGRRLLLGLALVLIIMEVGAEIVLPGWWLGFYDALVRYAGVNGNDSLLTVLIGNPLIALPLTAIIVLVVGYYVWQARDAAGDSDVLLHAICLALCATSIITPSYGLYNQAALVLPPALYCLAHASRNGDSSLRRVLLLLLIVSLAWTLALSLVFDLLYLSGGGGDFIHSYVYLPGAAALAVPGLTFAALLAVAPARDAELAALPTA